MRLACANLFRARWSEQVHEEWIRGVLRTRPELEGKLQQTRDAMNRAVADCLVTGYDGIIPAVNLPDPDDRHVLAAAIIGRADVIVTHNVKHFPSIILDAYNIDAQHPDVFVRHVLDLDTAIALSAVHNHRANLKRPQKTVDEYLDTLSRQGLPETVAFLRPWATLI